LRRLPLAIALVLAAFAAIAFSRPAPVSGSSNTPTPVAPLASVNPTAAARYLDSRELWWQQWPRAQKDHGTLCVSCHTNLPYALARPALQQQLHEPAAPPTETIFLTSVQTRVYDWAQMVPFYSDAANGPGKTAEAHATEAVLNAIILTSYDLRQPRLSPLARTALANAWALQLPSGSWQWQNFHYGPWESEESSYEGAALLFLQVESAPHHYAAEPAVRDHVARLRHYLQQQFPSQPLINQLYVLWASSKSPSLLTPGQHTALLQQLQTLQQSDGGWRLASLDQTQRQDDSSQPTESDGMATALVVLALETTGQSASDTTLNRGLHWLQHHQQPTGNWLATSLNKDRDPTSNVGLFMSDAATAYAILALQQAPPTIH
jgi:squalene-hopene/tetraprenyl-beta-curcumene cyclase